MGMRTISPGLQRHHGAEGPVVDGRHGGHTEAGGQHPVEGRRRAAPLDVAQDGDPGFEAGAPLDLLGQPGPDAAQAGVAERVDRRARRWPGGPPRRRALGRDGSLGHDHDGRELAAGVPARQPLAHGVESKGDLGHEDLGRAAGHTGVGGDPADVAAHHLAHDDPVVRLGRRPQAVDGVGGDLHGGVEPEGDLGARQVVVDGLGDPDAWTPMVASRLATPRVSSPPMATRASTPCAARVADDLLGPPHGEGVGTRRAQDGPPEGQDVAAADRPRARRHSSSRTPFHPSRKPTTSSPWTVAAGQHDGPDDGVEAGAVAAAGEDPEAHPTILGTRLRSRRDQARRCDSGLAARAWWAASRTTSNERDEDAHRLTPGGDQPADARARPGSRPGRPGGCAPPRRRPAHPDRPALTGRARRRPGGHVPERPQHVGHVGHRGAEHRAADRRAPRRRAAAEVGDPPAARSMTYQPCSVRHAGPGGSRRGCGWPATAPAGRRSSLEQPAPRRAASSALGSSSPRPRSRSRAHGADVARRAGRRPCRGRGACAPSWCRAGGPRPRSRRRPARAGRPEAYRSRTDVMARA